MSILEYLNSEKCKVIKERLVKLKEFNAPQIIIKNEEQKIEDYNNGKSLYHFSSRVPKERLDEEFIKIEDVIGPRGGHHTIINGKYELKYIKKFHIHILDIVGGF